MYLKHVLQSNHFKYITFVDVFKHVLQSNHLNYLTLLDVFEACSSMKSLYIYNFCSCI